MYFFISLPVRGIFCTTLSCPNIYVKSILGNLEPNLQTNHHIRFSVIVEAKSNGRDSKICYSTYSLISILFLNLKDGSI